MARHFNTTKFPAKDLRAALSKGKGLEAFHRIMREDKVKGNLLEDMDRKLASLDGFKKHLADETFQLGREKRSKEYILKHYRNKWGMNKDQAKDLLKVMIPEETGPSEDDIKKQQQLNVVLQRRFARLRGGSRGRFAGDQMANKGKDTRDRILNQHKPEDLRGNSAPNHTVGVVAAGEHAGVIGAAPSGATGLTNTRPLEVKESTMKVATHQGSGMAMKPGEKPKLPEEEKTPKKSPPPDLALAA